MTSKSIILPHHCIAGIIVYSYLISISIKDAFATSKKSYKEMEILDDLPLKTNMEEYLGKLEKIMQFVETHERYVDMNLAFGLFLINVNLKTIVRIRKPRIPESIKMRLDQVLNRNNKMMKYFQEMTKEHEEITEVESSAHFITDLFSGQEEKWSPHLQTFKSSLLKKTKFISKKELNEKFSKWSKYVEKVYDFEHYSPTPQVSDDCISSLSKITVNPSMRWQSCEVSGPCKKLVHKGSDYGYAITHRLLYIIMARFSRGCTILSPVEDKEAIDSFCSKIYNEAEYNSHHNFELPDLTMEQISLCTLEGHVQFLRRSWIDELIEFQKDIGCIASSVQGREKEPTEGMYEEEHPKWKLVDIDQDILGGSCNTHTTGVAASMLSAAIRYILEKFY